MMSLEEFGDAYVARVHHVPPALDPAHSALVLVDMQNCVRPEHYERFALERGMDPDDVRGALDEMRVYLDGVERNAEAVLAAARRAGVRPIHVRIQALLDDGADVGRLHASKNFRLLPGSWDGEFLPAVAPLPTEIVLEKSCSGAVVGTSLDRILRNLGIRDVTVIGYYTDQCVSTTARDLADLGYEVGLVEDACGALTPRRHADGIAQIANVYVSTESTAAFVARAGELAA